MDPGGRQWHKWRTCGWMQERRRDERSSGASAPEEGASEQVALRIKVEAIQDRDELKGRVHHILGKKGHKGEGAYGCAKNTLATTAGRGAIPS